MVKERPLTFQELMTAQECVSLAEDAYVLMEKKLITVNEYWQKIEVLCQTSGFRKDDLHGFAQLRAIIHRR